MFGFLSDQLSAPSGVVIPSCGEAEETDGELCLVFAGINHYVVCSNYR